MSSAKGGNEQKKGAISKAAVIAVGVGVAWGIFKFVKARKEEDALIREYYGDHDDFVIPDNDASDDDEMFFKEELGSSKILPAPPSPPPPPPPVAPLYKDELRIEHKEVITQVTEEPTPPVSMPEPRSEEKPWFLRLFDPPMKSENKPKFKESDSFEVKKAKPKERERHEIRKGDTLWAISGRYGVSLDALKATNGLHGDKIYAGDKLVIPEK